MVVYCGHYVTYYYIFMRYTWMKSTHVQCDHYDYILMKYSQTNGKVGVADGISTSCGHTKVGVACGQI